jgi:hypothetical protein
MAVDMANAVETFQFAALAKEPGIQRFHVTAECVG